MKNWNERMAKAIEDSPHTPNAFANKIGIKAPTVSAWIGAGNITPAANITAENLFKACDELGVNPRWIVTGHGPMRGRLTAGKDASEGKVNPDLSFAGDGVQRTNTATAEELKQQITKAIADEGLSDDLLNAIAWMIRAGTRTPVQGDQHHTKMVKIKNGRHAAKRGTGTE